MKRTLRLVALCSAFVLVGIAATYFARGGSAATGGRLTPGVLSVAPSGQMFVQMYNPTANRVRATLWLAAPSGPWNPSPPTGTQLIAPRTRVGVGFLCGASNECEGVLFVSPSSLIVDAEYGSSTAGYRVNLPFGAFKVK